ncbi:nuclear transport factor 2 family protein [Nocardia sp. NPDC003693]
MSFDRAELESFWQSWLEINRRAQELGDWSVMADHYEPDASYGWSYSATDQFMATGRDEIRELALGTEMLGFQGWVYPYQSAVIDEQNGQVVGFWRQRSTFTDPSGAPYEIPSLGCSWFQYSGNNTWSWQRDIFDAGIAAKTVGRMFKDRTNTPELDARVKAATSGPQPGHYPGLEQMSSPLWPIPAVDL